jgi:NADH-quinone oxidoreductase subunit N
MSSPVLWIGIPVVLAGLLYFLRQKKLLTGILGVVFTTLLALLANWLPIGLGIRIGPLSFKIADTLTVLGRHFSLTGEDLPFVVFIYLLAALIFLGSLFIEVSRLLVPIGLVVVALLVAALAVEPFLYAALIIEMAVMLCTILMTPPVRPLPSGLMRFLIFQTLAVPFILIAGWMLTGIEASPNDVALAGRAAAILGIGFVFWLAIFPFNSWVSLLAEQVSPYLISFLFIMLPSAIFMFGLNSLNDYTWLRENQGLHTFLQLAGVLTIATSGLWAAFQSHLGRVLGFALIANNGMALLAVGSNDHIGMASFAALLLPNAMNTLIFSLSLSLAQQNSGSLELRQLSGMAYRFPFIGAGVISSGFALAGMPFLPGFATRLGLYINVFASSPALVGWTFIGMLGFGLASLRTLAVFISRPEQEKPRINEKPAEIFILSVGLLALFLLGIFPQLFQPQMIKILSAFTHLP